MRAENELRTAATRRAAADPFALLCPGRRLVLSLPRRGGAAPAHADSDPSPSPSPAPGTPHASPGLEPASTSRVCASHGVCSRSSAGASSPEPNPGTHLSTGGLATSNGASGSESGTGTGEPGRGTRREHSAEQPAAAALHPERSAGQGADRGDPAPAGSPGATPRRAPASAAMSSAACPGGGTSSEHLKDAQAAGNGTAPSSAPNANGDAHSGGLEQRLDDVCTVSANGAADAVRAPRFAAAVLDAPQAAAAAAGARDCAVFIVPQVCCRRFPSGLCSACVSTRLRELREAGNFENTGLEDRY